MGALPKRNVTKIETPYVKHHEQAVHATERKKIRLIRRLVVFFVAAATITAFMVSTLISQAAAIEEKQTEKKQLEKKLGALQKDQQLLEEEIVKLNDDEYIAKIARRDYFLSEENEMIFNLPKKEEKSSTDESTY